MTTTQKPTKVNPWYARCAMKDMLIDMDQDGLFCQVPSESDASTLYTVRADESGVVPVAASCNCVSKKPCKHMTLVNSYYARIYKSNVTKAEAKQAKQENSVQIHSVKTLGRENVRGKQPTRRSRFTSSFDRRHAMSASPRSTDVGMLGALNTNRAFSLMR